MGNGIPHADIPHVFGPGNQVPHFAGGQFLFGESLKQQRAHFFHFILTAGGHEANFVPFADFPVKYSNQRHHAPVIVKTGIKNQRLQRGFRVAFRRGNALNDGLHHFIYSLAGLRTGEDDFLFVAANQFNNLMLNRIHLRVGEVNFIDDGNNHQIVINGLVQIGNGLCFHPLGRIHQQQCPFGRRQAAGDFVGKVHMPRGVN